MRVYAQALAVVGWILVPLAAHGETHEVKMLNRGPAGAMVFDPEILRIAPGDSVKFVAQDRGHNAETILAMLPQGAEPFKGGINQEIEVTFPIAGTYVYKCAPHVSMGMVGMIVVGDVAQPDTYDAVRVPPLVRAKIEAWATEFPTHN